MEQPKLPVDNGPGDESLDLKTAGESPVTGIHLHSPGWVMVGRQDLPLVVNMGSTNSLVSKFMDILKSNCMIPLLIYTEK